MLVDDDGIWLGEQREEIVMKVAKEVAAYFKRRKLVSNQVIEKELEDGGLLLSAKVAHGNQVLPIVRYWIPHIRIISPNRFKPRWSANLPATLGAVSAQPLQNSDRLLALLSVLDDNEFQAIWCQALRCEPDQDGFDKATRQQRIELISMEWRAIHGHTLVNLFREEHTLPWKRILIDVADKLHPGVAWTSYTMDDGHTEEEIEADIRRMYDKRVQDMWNKMSPSDKEKLAQTLDGEFNAAASALTRTGQVAGVRSITVSSLGSGISAGLLTGAGALTLAQGATSMLVGGLLGGTLYQIGLWLVVRLFGFWSGAQLVASGGAAAVGGALLSAPAAALLVANAVMSTSYRKTIPATMQLLMAHELRRQFDELKV